MLNMLLDWKCVYCMEVADDERKKRENGEQIHCYSLLDFWGVLISITWSNYNKAVGGM